MYFSPYRLDKVVVVATLSITLWAESCLAVVIRSPARVAFLYQIWFHYLHAIRIYYHFTKFNMAAVRHLCIRTIPNIVDKGPLKVLYLLYLTIRRCSGHVTVIGESSVRKQFACRRYILQARTRSVSLNSEFVLCQFTRSLLISLLSLLPFFMSLLNTKRPSTLTGVTFGYLIY